MAKRKLDIVADADHDGPLKRIRTTPSEVVQTRPTSVTEVETHPPGNNAPCEASRENVAEKTERERNGEGNTDASGPKHKVRKLVPPRPFPTVPSSVSATGPRSAHTEGKNLICITRRTELGAYLRRCKDLFLKDGYKTLHLSAMGAAIPHLMQLALSLPSILPYPPDEIHTEIFTGTVEVQDELVPEDEDEDIAYRTRGKSTVSVVIKVGDGVDEPLAGPARGSGRKSNLGRTALAATGQSGSKGEGKSSGKQGRKGGVPTHQQVVFREAEMEDT